MKNNYYILRHGKTSYQEMEKPLIYPWPEPDPILLTEKGKNQIKKRAEELESKGIDMIFASPYPRTKESAEIVSHRLGLEIHFDERLVDINFGSYKGEPVEEMREDPAYTDFHKSFPGGESREDVKERMSGFLKELEGKYEGKNILIISHGDPLWLLEGEVKGKDNRMLLSEKIDKRTIKTGELRKL